MSQNRQNSAFHTPEDPKPTAEFIRILVLPINPKVLNQKLSPFWGLLSPCTRDRHEG